MMGYYRYYSCDVPDLADQQLGLRDTDRVSEVRDQKRTETETRRSRVSPAQFCHCVNRGLVFHELLAIKKVSARCPRLRRSEHLSDVSCDGRCSCPLYLISYLVFVLGVEVVLSALQNRIPFRSPGPPSGNASLHFPLLFKTFQ